MAVNLDNLVVDSLTEDVTVMSEENTSKLLKPSVKKQKLKSPTPQLERSLSRTPQARKSRSQTPFNVYLTRRSEDPTEPAKWRSITPFINRDDKEKTPFELGKDIKAQLISHKMVFDKASVMDVSESDFEPVRYITSDMSVVDRACVMDISNVEVIYMVEEYEEEEEVFVEELEPVEETKTKKPRKGRKPKSVDKEDSPIISTSIEKKTKKKSDKKKKGNSESRSRSRSPSRTPSPTPTPKLTLKLELGGGPKINKKLFEKKPDVAVALAKPPQKKSILAMQMEEQAKEAAKMAAAAISRESERQLENNNQDEVEAEEDEDEDEEASNQDDEQESQDIEFDDETTAEIKNETLNENSDNDNNDTIRKSLTNSEHCRQSFSQADDGGNNGQTETKLSDLTSQLKIEEKTRSPSPALPPPKPASYWKKLAATEGDEFMEKVKFYNSVKHEKPHYPVFVTRLKDKCATEGQTIRLVCAVCGPNLQIKWYKDDCFMKFGERYNFLENDDIISLEIYDSIPSDTADYKCTISNKYNQISCTAYVNVCEMHQHRYEDETSPPNIVYFENSYHYMDDKLIIECQIQGIPRPIVKWSKDCIDIIQNKDYSLLEGAHGSYKIIIYHPSAKDNGIYVVNAINSRGYVGSLIACALIYRSECVYLITFPAQISAAYQN